MDVLLHIDLDLASLFVGMRKGLLDITSYRTCNVSKEQRIKLHPSLHKSTKKSPGSSSLPYSMPSL